MTTVNMSVMIYVEQKPTSFYKVSTILEKSCVWNSEILFFQNIVQVYPVAKIENERKEEKDCDKQNLCFTLFLGDSLAQLFLFHVIYI